MRRALHVLTILATTVLALLCAQPALAQTPPSLTGETFGDNFFPLDVQCNPDGTSSFTFQASGSDVFGPYPGTFTANASGTFGPGPTAGQPDFFGLDFGPTLTFDETFTINSPSTGTTITGEKHLIAVGEPGLGQFGAGIGACGEFQNVDFGGFQDTAGEGFSISAALNYEATINSPQGTFIDRGTSHMSHVHAEFTHSTGDSNLSGFGQFFFSTEIVPAGPATLTLAPKADTNDVDTEHCVTATVENSSGNPTPNVVVRFTVTGSVNTSGSAATNANGEATFCYQGPQLPGADAIRAFADTDEDQTEDTGEPADTATKVWTLPTSTPLCEAKITQGGWIIANNGDRGSFGGNAKADANGDPSGSENYRDHGPAQPLHVKSTEVTAITCNPERTRATIFGRATIDGTGSHVFRIDVQDLAEPGKGADTYRIQLDTGYDSGEHPLLGGNVQIHKP